jgi:hypothetical protein
MSLTNVPLVEAASPGGFPKGLLQDPALWLYANSILPVFDITFPIPLEEMVDAMAVRPQRRLINR